MDSILLFAFQTQQGTAADAETNRKTQADFAVLGAGSKNSSPSGAWQGFFASELVGASEAGRSYMTSALQTPLQTSSGKASFFIPFHSFRPFRSRPRLLRSAGLVQRAAPAVLHGDAQLQTALAHITTPWDWKYDESICQSCSLNKTLQNQLTPKQQKGEKLLRGLLSKLRNGGEEDGVESPPRLPSHQAHQTNSLCEERSCIKLLSKT